MRGLGIDLCGVERIERELKRSDAFLRRFFTDGERAYIASRGQMGAQSAAAMFAAKEAAAKALGTGFKGIRYTDIEILHSDSGAPYIELHGPAADLAAGRRAQVSITHNRTSAAAVVLLGGTE